MYADCHARSSRQTSSNQTRDVTIGAVSIFHYRFCILFATGTGNRFRMARQINTATRRCNGSILALCLMLPSGAEAGADDVLQLMESVVVPASDAIWQAEDPLSVESREKLQKPVEALDDAGRLLSTMGSPYHGEEGARRQGWQAGAMAMSTAARQILKAIRGEDIDAFYDASDALYNQCVACHDTFHPDVAN